jgi:ABC-2 type transport system permease protein
MWRGLAKLTWLEMKIFMREPLGAVGTIVIPVVVFVGAGRMFGGGAMRTNPLAISTTLSSS